jgi:pantoate kinase
VPHEIGHEEHRALEDAHEQEVAAAVVVGDLVSELADAPAQRVRVDERVADAALEL